ncbi:MAG: DUF58 domain-containing protein [Marinisporobacter sp.]|nr:DUF58 domain-containing protein [Marinisporobacter sp.]
MSIEIKNNGIFPITNVQISIHYTNNYLPYGNNIMFVTSVLAGKTQLEKFFLNSKHCGELYVSISTVKIFDPLSLFQQKVKVGRNKEEISVMVFPNFYDEKTLPDLNMNIVNEVEDVYSLHKSGNDPSEVFDIREYRPGDRQQQIHWKLSLKQENLMVREFSQPICNCFTIFMDFNVKSLSENVLSSVDNMLQTALSLSYYLQKNYVRHNIVWFDMRDQNTDSININCEDDIYTAIQYLFSIPLYEGESKGKKLYHRDSLEKPSGNILYFEPGIIPNALNCERRVV